MHPLRQALRQFRSHPWFSALVIVLLGLGIGANTAMFSVVHAVLIRPLPYPASGDLVTIRRITPNNDSPIPGRGDFVTDIDFLAWRGADLPAFQDFAAQTTGQATWLQAGGAQRVSVGNASDAFFPMFGINAWRGRLPSGEDFKHGIAPVAVLSFDFWQSRFGGSDEVIGTMMTLDGQGVTVIGVLPASFYYHEPVQVWRPMPLSAEAATPGHFRLSLLRVFARLKPGADHTAALAQLDQIAKRTWNLTESPAPAAVAASTSPRNVDAPARESVRRAPDSTPTGASVSMQVSVQAGAASPGGAPRAGASPGPTGGPGNPGAKMMASFAAGTLQIVPLQEHLAGQAKSSLWLLLGAVLLVLLIACVNIANLQLARATVRRRELAVRAALGASRGQLAGGLLMESVLLAIIGGALGLLLAWFGIKGIHILLAGMLPRVNPIAMDLPVLGFSIGSALLTGLAFGLAPAWMVRGVAMQEALHTDGRTGTGTAGRSRWRMVCVALEIALALALVVDAALLLKSFTRLRGVELGFRTTDVLVASLALPERYREPARTREFAAKWQDALQKIPGVSSVATADRAPLSDSSVMMVPRIEGRAPGAPGTEAPLSAMSISPEFMGILGIPLKSGRALTAADGDGAPDVVMVNEAFVRRYFPDTDPIGNRISSPNRGRMATIVGVVGDMRQRGLERDAAAEIYFPFTQWTQPRLSAVLRITGDESEIGRAVAQTVRQLDPELPFDPALTLEARLDRMLAPRKLMLTLLGGFAGVAVLLAGIGIFGVMAYSVAQRTHEFGVRLALGAEPSRILRHVLTGSGVAIAIGVTAGIFLAVSTSHLLASMLYSVSRYDPWVIAATALGLALVGIVASLLPALRASRVNPIVALRSD